MTDDNEPITDASTLNLSGEETVVLFDILSQQKHMGDEREETESIYQKIRRQL